ncbi:MAG TPA: tail fiber domain-containing protein, partial [Pyrinomonadaceae bacterium]|nr:tail fiber domain-containing protein [Pyrinomonadaceae bacterium]
INGSSITNINASNITTGTLDNARLGTIPTANIADGAVTAAKIGSNQVVKNINGLTDNVSLVAGANVTLTPSGNTLTISAATGSPSPWSTNGANVFYNLGNVGIGTDTPDVSLRVHHSSSTVGVANPQLPDLALALRNTSNTNGNVTLISFQDSSGFGNAQVGAVQTNHVNHSADLVFLTRNAGAIGERLRIRSDGVVTLNTLGTAGGVVLCRNASNQIAACSSSLRYKTNIAPFAFGLNLVQRLRPIRFEWKEGGMKDVGFGAEDVAAIEPLLVTYNDKGEVEGVKYDRFSAVLVNAVKEQQTQIEAQHAQLAAQQKQLENQQLLIEALKRLVCRQNPSVDICR